MLTHPDISVVGVPKSGTSSLHSWLDQQPGVCGSSPKETFYFMDSGNPLTNQQCHFETDQCRQYHSFFSNQKPGDITLDSTTHYFFQQTAMQQLGRAGTKVCVVLREPATRLVSYFQYVCETRDALSKPVGFGEFVDGLLQNDVRHFRDCFYEEREFFALQTALQQGHYADYLEQWNAYIEPDNLLIVLFEDLVANQDQVLRQIAQFFGVSVNAGICAMSKDNETYKAKFPRINKIARSLARRINSERFKRPIRRLYVKFQKSEVTNIKAGFPDHIERLKRYYTSHIGKFADTSGVDISAWRTKNEFIPGG